MDNPNYTEAQINKQLAKRPLPVTVCWNGDDTAETPIFAVYLGDDETPYHIEDNDDTFDVFREVGQRRYESMFWASGYHDIADQLVDLIKEDIDAGVLSLPDEED